MTITIKIKNVYGSTTYYPVCPRAQLFASIAGTKTLTQAAINDIRSLGYAINVQPQTL
jgi:hypothetical protein